MTRLSVMKSVRHLVAKYRSFIMSSYRLADQRLREQFEAHVNEADALLKGRYLIFIPGLRAGHTLTKLLASGCARAPERRGVQSNRAAISL